MRSLLRFLPKPIRDRVIRSQLRIDDDEVAGLVVKVATTVDEHEQASRLVHAAYLKRGIIEAQRSGIWVTAHGLLPGTVVFVAKHGEHVVGTMSLVVDSAVGLPMDKIYGGELASLRAGGRRIAEVGALCVGNEHRRRGVALLLNKITWRCAKEILGIQSLVIAVHPNAACMYEATLRFEALGPRRTYPGLTKEAEAVALHLDLETSEQVLARDFAMLGPDPRNPYYLYCVRQDPQIVLPTANELHDLLEGIRRLTGARLGAMRPECFEDLSTPERRLLREVFPTLGDHLRSLPILIAEPAGSNKGS